MVGASSRTGALPTCASAAADMGRCTASGSSPWPDSLVCDTALVAPLSRRLRRIEEPRMAAIGLAVVWLVVLAAYGYALAISPTTSGGALAAAAVVGIAATGLLYAWRAVTGASVESP